MDLPGLNVRFGMDYSGFDSGASHVMGTANNIGRSMSGLGSIISGTLATAGGFVVAQVGMQAFGAGMNFVKSAAVGLNDQLQQNKIGFTTMLGSAQAADSFLQQLAQFAAKTPFTFPGLVTATQQMLGMGFAAGEVIPLLTAIGNAASAMGTGQQGIDRITLALGQMHAHTTVDANDMLQLTQAGIPAWQILADAIHKTVSETQDLAQQGKLSANVFITAFQQYSQMHFGDMMEQQSHTFSGAMSTISDSLRMGIAKGFQPFFDKMSMVADKLGTFLSGPKFSRDVATISQLSQQAADSLSKIFKAIQAGDLSKALEPAKSILISFISGMFGAGYNTIATYAQGMWSAATSILSSVENNIAQSVADLFIGHSPPPKGPLSQIDKGGQAVMESWAGGLSAGMQSVLDVADDAAGAFKQLGLSMTLQQGQQALMNATGDLDAMKAASADVNAQIDKLDHALADLDAQAFVLQRQIDNINTSFQRMIDPLQSEIDNVTKSYDDQINALQSQVNLLQTANQYEAQRVNLAEQLAQIQVTQEQIAAQGDQAQREALQEQLDGIQLKEQGHDLDSQIADIQAQIAAAQSGSADATANQNANLQVQSAIFSEIYATKQRTNALDQAAANNPALKKFLDDHSRVAGLLNRGSGITRTGEAQGVDNQALNVQQQTLAVSQQQKQVDIEGLQLKLQDLETQKALFDLTDQGATVQADADQRKLDQQKQQNDLSQQEMQIKNSILAIPLEQKMDTLKQAEKDALAPLQAQLDSLKADQTAAIAPIQAQLDLVTQQTNNLTEQRKQWQLLAGDISTALAPLQAAADAAKKNKDKGTADAGPALETQPLDTGKAPTIPKIDGEAIGKKIAGDIGRAIANYLRQNAGKLIGGAIGGLIGEAVFGPIGGLLGAFIGGKIGAGIQGKLAASGVSVSHGLSDMIAHLKEGDVAGAFKPLGDALGRVFTNLWDKIKESTPGLIANLVSLGASAIAWLTTDGYADLLIGVAKLAGALIDWVVPQIPGLIVNLGLVMLAIGKWFVTDFSPFWINKLDEFGHDLVSWVEPRIPELLKYMGELLTKLGDWIENTAGPEIAKKAAEWGPQLWAWIKDEVPKIPDQFEDVKTGIGSWIDGVALDIALKAGQWGAALFSWVADEVTKLPDQMGALLDGLRDWIDKTALPWIKTNFPDIGGGIVNAIVDGMTALGPWLAQQIEDLIVSALPGPLQSAAKKFLGIGGGSDSPSSTAGGGGVSAHAAGGRNLLGGLSLVGENGPELVSVPHGADVYSAGQTGAMLSQGGGPTHMVLPINIGGREIMTIIADLQGQQVSRVYQ